MFKSLSSSVDTPPLSSENLSPDTAPTTLVVALDVYYIANDLCVLNPRDYNDSTSNEKKSPATSVA